MKNVFFAGVALTLVLSLGGCGKDPVEPEVKPDLQLNLVIGNAEGSGFITDAKLRDAELARAEAIVRVSK